MMFINNHYCSLFNTCFQYLSIGTLFPVCILRRSLSLFKLYFGKYYHVPYRICCKIKIVLFELAVLFLLYQIKSISFIVNICKF